MTRRSRRAVLLAAAGSLGGGAVLLAADTQQEPFRDAVPQPNPFGPLTVTAFTVSADGLDQPLTVRLSVRNSHESGWHLEGRIDYHKTTACDSQAPVAATSQLDRAVPPSETTITLTDYTPTTPGVYQVSLREYEGGPRVRHERVSVGQSPTAGSTATQR
jgi:hypothetical protein